MTYKRLIDCRSTYFCKRCPILSHCAVFGPALVIVVRIVWLYIKGLGWPEQILPIITSTLAARIHKVWI